MNENIDKNVTKLRPFTKFLMTIGELPTSYLMSMTYYEQIIWFTKYLQEQVIPAINNNAEAIEEIQNFLKNLDLQDEVNNKLDEMADDGTLQEIMADYLNTKAIFGFNSVNDMIESENLINGSYAKTMGYYSANDGGSGLYLIRNITNNDEIDNGSIIAIADENLVAELIIDDYINVKQFGAKGDGTTDDTSYVRTAVAYAKKLSDTKSIQTTVYFPNSKYVINGKIDFPILQVNMIGDEAEILTSNTEDEIFHLMGERLIGSIRKIEGFTFRNTNENRTTTTLFFVGSHTYTEGEPTDVGAQFTINKCYFLHYGYAILTGHNSYLFSLNNCNSGNCYSVIKTQGTYNTGENIIINDCILTAFTKCLDITKPNFQINCNNTSFDAGKQVLSMLSAVGQYKGNLINFNHCHFEPSGLEDPMIEIVSGDISRINIIGCTSFINTTNDYLIKLNNENQFVTLKDNFFTFGTNPPAYLCNRKNIECSGNEYQINLLKNNIDNLFINSTLNNTTISDNLIKQGGESINTDKYYIFRDNTSYNTGINRLTSTNANLTLNTELHPETTGKSIKVTCTNPTDLIICAMAQYKGQDVLKGKVKLLVTQNYDGKIDLNACYWNGLTTNYFVSNFKQTIDLSTITPNTWIELDIPVHTAHCQSDGKYWGYAFSITGNNKPSTAFEFYIASPILQQV